MRTLNALRLRPLGRSRSVMSIDAPLYLDFLAPITLRRSSRRCLFFSAKTATNDSHEPDERSKPGNQPTKPSYILSKAQREYLDGALRVNQAGELAATLIYAAQKPPVIRSHPHLRPLMKHMYDQEAVHLSSFNHLVAKHQVRPTAMYPIWEVAATFLGWSTAVMGREAAMACTEAVETEIGTHYNEQVSTIMGWMKEAERRGEEVDDELKDLLALLRKTRDEELEHLDHAVENDSKEAKPYDPLVNVIRSGCRTAINISERL
jgi:3-demethoxyubiquinol 3-hydroxylase